MIPRTRFDASLLAHNPFRVLEDERPAFGRVNVFPTTRGRGGAVGTGLGYNGVILNHETGSEGANRATIFRFKPAELIGDLNVDLPLIKDEMLRLAAGSKAIILNFDGVRQLDSAALGIFTHGLRREGKQIIFCNVGQFISEQLKVTKLNTVIKTYPTEALALSGLGIPE